MKAQILTLALAAQLAHAVDNKSPIEIFESLTPQASVTLSPAQRSATHPSLAAIPADVDAALNLSQPAQSLAALQKIFPQMELPPQAAEIITQIEDVSIAFGKGSSQSFAGYATLIIWLADLQFKKKYLEPQDIIPFNERSLNLLEEATQNPLPSIYLSARVSDQLRPQVAGMLSMISPMLESPEASQAHEIMSKSALLTQMKSTQVGGMEGVELSFKILDKEIKYTVLYQLRGNDLLIIGSQNPDELSQSLAPQNSLLVSPALQLTPQQDAHLYVGEKDFAGNIFRAFIGSAVERDSIVRPGGKIVPGLREANKAILDAIVDLFPQPTEGALNASLSLAGGMPLLQARWKNNQYQFEATPFKDVNLLGTDPEIEYFMMSELSQRPSLAPIRKAFSNLIMLKGDDPEEEEMAAILQLGELLTGQVLTISKEYDDFAYLGVKDAAKAKELLIKIEDNSHYFYPEEEEEIVKGKLPHDTIVGADFFVVSDDDELSLYAVDCPEGASHSGALFKFNLRQLKPFKTFYGRLDKNSDTLTFKIQLR